MGVCVLFSAAASAVWTTNLVQLDDGTCGRNLQVGSDTTASSSATPTFRLMGDGPLSSYRMFVDGVAIGTVGADGYSNVCISAPARLGDGSHVLSGSELAPHPLTLPAPFSFSVDTVPPAPPSRPLLSTYSDSGVLGDGITSYRNLNFSGSSEANAAIQLYSAGTVLGGARADQSGRWSATTISLGTGSLTITAVALDAAGNTSIRSDGTTVAIVATDAGGAAPTTTAATTTTTTTATPTTGSGGSGATTTAGVASSGGNTGSGSGTSAASASPTAAQPAPAVALSAESSSFPSASTSSVALAHSVRGRTLTGSAHDDLLIGSARSDTLKGRAGNDVLRGGRGNDSLYGGPGADHLEGGAGNDRIYARDRNRDRINCGPGRDHAYVDRHDAAAADCEYVHRL